MRRQVLKKIRNKNLPVSAIADCVKQLHDGHVQSSGLRMKRLKGIDLPVFEARVNRDIRLIFTLQPATVYQEKGGNDRPRVTVTIWDVDHHDDALNRARRINYDAVQKLDYLSLTTGLHADAVEEEIEISKLPEYPWVPISVVQQAVKSANSVLNQYCRLHYRGEDWWLEQAAQTDVESLRDAHEFCEVDIERIDEELARIAQSSEDFLLHLLPEQMEFVRKPGPLLLSGTVGSGKTTIMLYHLYRRAKSHPHGRYLVVTYSPTLTNLCRLLFEQLPEGSDLLRRQVDILSYEQLLRVRFPDVPIVSYAQRRQQFAQAYRNAAARWRRLDTVPKPLREWRKAHPDFWDEETLWAQYWDAVKGQLNWQTQEPLDRDGYVNAVELLEQQQEHEAIYETLQTWFQFEGEDELDLSRRWWQERDTILPEYDGVYVDEVQDLCEVQWMILLRLVDHPHGLFLTGDPFQALRPSGFHWNRLRARLQQAANVQDGSLGMNLRNSRQIARFVEEELRRFKGLYRLDEQPDYHVDALLEGLPPVGAKAASCPPEQVADWLRGQGALIVWDDEERQDEFVQRCAEAGARLVTVQEAKGLEFDRAAVYGIYGRMNQLRRVGSSVQRQWAYSRLYVALTRARRGLWIIEPNPSDLPERLQRDWQAWLTGWAEAETLPVLSLDAIGETPERHEAEGDYPRAAYLYEQTGSYGDAGRCYEQAGRYADAGRCYEQAEMCFRAGWRYEKAGRYADAGRCYKQAEMCADAGRCYEKVGRYADAGRCYEQAGDKKSAARCWAKQAKREGQTLIAAQWYEQAEMYADAGRCYDKAGRYADAGRCYKQAGRYADAGRCYDKAGRYADAGRCYEKAGRYADAGRCYEKAGDKKSAARCWAKQAEREGQTLIAAQWYEQAEMYADAGWCYEKAGRYADAGRCYEQAGDKKSAARCWAKQAKREGQTLIAAQRYEQAEMYADAGSCYKQAGRYADAGRCYKQAEMYADAGRCYKQAEMYADAGSCYKQAGRYADAGSCYKQAEMYADAGRCYEKAGWYVDARWCYVKAGEYADAGLCYVKAGSYADAGRCYEKDGRYADAGRCYDKAGDKKSAARCWAKQAEQKGQTLKAAQLYEKAGMYADAGRCYEQAEMYANARWCYYQAEMYVDAGRCYEKDGRYAAAGRCYEQAGDSESAARCWAKQAEREGQTLKVAQWYEQAGRYADAGRCYEQAEMYADAVRCYEQAEMYADAGRCYEQAGDSESAARCWAKQAEREGQTLKAAHWYEQAGDKKSAARCWAKQAEQKGQTLKAAQLYEQADMYADAARCYEKAGLYDLASLCYERAGDSAAATRCRTPRRHSQ
jgi:tetratricopeptide (TPR) repeat protein